MHTYKLQIMASEHILILRNAGRSALLFIQWHSFNKRLLSSEYFVYLQHITNNSYAPHICSKTYCVKVDNFWCNKLWCPKENLKFLTRIILSCQSKVNYFYSVSCSGETKYIFRLKTRNIIIYFYCNLNILKRLGLVIGRIVKIPMACFGLLQIR